MEDGRFQKTAEQGLNMLRAAFSGMAPGEIIAYNAYFHGQEVVVVGYQYWDGAHTNTKPLGILVDEEVFTMLRVDDESGRYEGDDTVQPKKVI